jgi:transposase
VRPVARQHHGYEWIYVYGFVRPTTGDVECLLLPTVNSATFSIALKHFADAVGASETNRIILVLDGAGFHTGKDVVWPTGIHPYFLPPYSPELQPAEKLWPLVREATANTFIATLDELEETLIKRWQYLISAKDLIAAHTRFEWWPEDKDQ